MRQTWITWEDKTGYQMRSLRISRFAYRGKAYHIVKDHNAQPRIVTPEEFIKKTVTETA